MFVLDFCCCNFAIFDASIIKLFFLWAIGSFWHFTSRCWHLTQLCPDWGPAKKPQRGLWSFVKPRLLSFSFVTASFTRMSKTPKILQFFKLLWNPIQCHINSASSVVQLSWVQFIRIGKKARQTLKSYSSVRLYARAIFAIQSIHIPPKCKAGSEQKRMDPSWGWQRNVPPFHFASSHPGSGYLMYNVPNTKYDVSNTKW